MSYGVVVIRDTEGYTKIHDHMFKIDQLCYISGGLIVIIFRERYLQTKDEFSDKFEPYVKQLESEGQWVLLEKTSVPGHLNDVAVKFVFKVTKQE